MQHLPKQHVPSLYQFSLKAICPFQFVGPSLEMYINLHSVSIIYTEFPLMYINRLSVYFLANIALHIPFCLVVNIARSSNHIYCEWGFDSCIFTIEASMCVNSPHMAWWMCVAHSSCVRRYMAVHNYVRRGYHLYEHTWLRTHMWTHM